MADIDKLLSLPGLAIAFLGNCDEVSIFIEPISTFLAPRADSYTPAQKQSSLNEFEEWLNRYRSGKIFGFMSYEAFHYTETLPHALHDTLHFPAGAFCAYRRVIEVKDTGWNILTVHQSSDHLWGNDVSPSDIAMLVQYGQTLIKNNNDFHSTTRTDIDAAQFCSLEEQKAFQEKISDIKAAITRGEVYQANLSLPFEVKTTKTTQNLFLDSVLFEKSKHACFFNCHFFQDNLSIISNSPETFIVRNHDSIVAAPIKGTIRSEPDPIANKKALDSLVHSQKDLAELAMIIDLFRNDFGKVAQVGSVSVGPFPSSMSLNHLHHLFAEVRARVSSHISDLSLILSCFPSGSISGAPKYTALKIITELEQHARGVYCGAFFAFDESGFKSSVAIRTAIRREDTIMFRAGCGITIDSDPGAELQEAFVKAKGLLRAAIQY